MRRDPTEFRQRFLAYKEGKMPYENGLPKYDTGKVPDVSFSDDEAMDYILRLENPNRIGFTNGIWRPPTDARKYDVHQIGGGLDMREEHNPIVYNFLKSKGRLNNPYLTELEEKDLRLQTWNQKKRLMDKFVLQYGDSISLLGYDTVAAMLWHGHPFKVMNIPTTITGKALAKAIENGDRDLSSVFNAYYGYGTNATRFASRVNADSNYRNAYKPSQSTAVDKSKLVQQLEAQPEFKYWQNYHQPDYSFDNPAPETISSWNNATGPAYTGSALQAHRADNNIGKIILDAALSDNDVGDVLMDNLSKTVFGGKKLGFKNGKLPGYKIGHNVSHADKKSDGSFTDDYTKVFEDMYVTPLKTDLKRGSYTLNNFPYYLQHRTDWMKPFMSSGTNEKGLELIHPEFDLLLGGRLLATELLPLKTSKYRELEKIDFDNIAKQATKMKADDEAWNIAHPEYNIENIIKKLKLPNDSEVLDFVLKSNLEQKSTRDVLANMLYENKDIHGKQILNLHNNRARLTGDPVNAVGEVFNVDDPIQREKALQWLEDNYFGTRNGAEYAFNDPEFLSRLKGFSLPRANRPVFISKNKIIDRQELALGRKLTLLEADDLYNKVVSHERHHAFGRIHNTPEGFDFSRIKPEDYFARDGFDELAARGTLLKNMFGLINKPLTGAHLKYAESLYFKDPSNINNNMLEFFNLITDYNKAAKWLLDNASAIVPVGLSTATVSTIPEYKNGKSPIHIKPANRGKFTALKKRTGHSASWFKENGTPAQKKMAVFALNAKKWKH